MIEQKIGGVEFTDASITNADPYIIGLFGEEHTGKTRFGLTGPNTIGCVVTEVKSYATLDKDAKELGKRVLKPKDPMALIVNQRKVASMADDIERQRFYMTHVKMVEDVTHALLAHKDVSLLIFDKLTQYCFWKEFAINGMTPKFVKIEGRVYQSKNEVRQSIIDFINSLSVYRKPVILTCATKPDYDVTDSKGDPIRNTWDAGAFYMLGSHCNLVCEMQTNPYWDVNKKGDKYDWKYRLNVRRCQRNPNLEGPDGNPLLKDDAVTLPYLIQAVDPNADLEQWM